MVNGGIGSDGIILEYATRRWSRNLGLIPWRERKMFSAVLNRDRLWGPSSFYPVLGNGASLSLVKGDGREAEYLSLCCAWNNDAWSCITSRNTS